MKGRIMATYADASDVRNEDRIDSRDLIELADELRALPADERSEDDDELIRFVDEAADGIEDWPYGATLVAEWDFEDYARELAEDIGAIDPDASWPLMYIDWEAAANALRMDYTSVDLLGTTYLVRS